MGLIRAIKEGAKTTANTVGGAVKETASGIGGSVFSGIKDAFEGTIHSAMWVEYFVSGDMSNGILMKRGEKVNAKTGKNAKGDDNIITSGSGIDVQEGQCMILVENGRIVEFCAEPGRYTYDSSLAPSFFYGENKGLAAVAEEFKRQFATGGTRFNTQRVYFINMGVIWDPIKWGLGSIPFRHTVESPVNPNLNRAISIAMKAHGTIQVRIANPLNFYKSYGAQLAGGDNNGVISMAMLEERVFSGVKSKIGTAISAAITNISNMKPCRYADIMMHHQEIDEMVTEHLASTTYGQSGFGFSDFAIEGSPEVNSEYTDKIAALEDAVNMATDPLMAQYSIEAKRVGALDKAAGESGATGLMNMGMVMPGGMFGGQASNFAQFAQMPQYQQPQAAYGQPQQNMYQQPQPQATPAPAVAPQATSDSWTCSCGETNVGKFCMSCGAKKPEPVQAGAWVCSCGNSNTGKFCMNCGAKKPEETNDASWTCSCATENTGKFCPNCGSKKPEKPKKLRCDKCGWEAEEGVVTKFCPNCGDIVTEADFS